MSKRFHCYNTAHMDPEEDINYIDKSTNTVRSNTAGNRIITLYYDDDLDDNSEVLDGVRNFLYKIAETSNHWFFS